MARPLSITIGSWIEALFARKQTSAISVPVTDGLSPFSLEGFDDPRNAIRFGYIVIVLGLGGFLVWAFFAPIGEGVPAQGIVVTESHRKLISHLTGGTVSVIHVSENQFVKEGNPLIGLVADRAQTAYYTALNEQLNAAAKLARLTAEQAFAGRIEFSEEVRQMAEELGRKDILAAQEQLFSTRRKILVSEESILKENLAASEMQKIGLRQQLIARTQQESLLSQEVEISRDLVESGFTPRTRLMEQERQLAETQSTKSELQTRIARESSSSAEIRLRLLQRRQEFLKEIETQVSEVQREYVNLGERAKDAGLELERTTIRASVSGQVVSLMPQAPGSIITPGAKLMEIVPIDDKLLLDVQIPVHVIQRVSPGLETDIRITSFPDTPSLIIDGKVLSISSDIREPTNATDKPHYLARVEVTPEGIEKLNGRHLRPGMSADVVIRTGERSFAKYLIAPFTRSLFNAFKEP